jgi:hypothetical protein
MEYFFDHEKLDVYQPELEFVASVAKRFASPERIRLGKETPARSSLC